MLDDEIERVFVPASDQFLFRLIEIPLDSVRKLIGGLEISPFR